MRKLLTLSLAATTAISAVAFSTAASAYDFRDYYYRNHDNNDVAGAAIVAGVIGLAIGAALASSSHNNGYYDNGYYGRGYNNYGGGYGSYGYSQPYYGGGYGGYGSYGGYGYGQPYYGGGYSYQRCYTTRSWDPYYGGYVSRRVCR